MQHFRSSAIFYLPKLSELTTFFFLSNIFGPSKLLSFRKSEEEEQMPQGMVWSAWQGVWQQNLGYSKEMCNPT